MIIGGRDFNYSKAEIEARMESVPAEPIQMLYVYIAGKRFPPKQVLATVTGWARDTFGTQSATRALMRAGFICARRDEGDHERMSLSLQQRMLYDKKERSLLARTGPVDERLAQAEALIDVLYQEVRRLKLAVADLKRGENG